MNAQKLKDATEIHRAHLKNDPEYRKHFLRKIIGPPRRELSESEGKEIMTILSFLKPISTHNNQHTFTEVYEYNNTTYKVHYGLYDYPLVEEMLKE